MLGKNTKKYIHFSVPIKKELDNGKSITCKKKFIDTFRFMSYSLSTLVDNLSDSKFENMISVNILALQLITLLECFHCIAWFKKDRKELTKRFRNTYELCN